MKKIIVLHCHLTKTFLSSICFLSDPMSQIIYLCTKHNFRTSLNMPQEPEQYHTEIKHFKIRGKKGACLNYSYHASCKFFPLLLSQLLMRCPSTYINNK